MSDSKNPKNTVNVPKKSQPAKTEVGTNNISKTETVSTETKKIDTSTSKSVSPPKSASQSSTSHFSSVSTPQYRSGWNNIFGNKGNVKKIIIEEASNNKFPKKLNILDYDIDLVLRAALDSAFSDVAKKRGINLKSAKEIVRFKYSLSCEINEK